MKIVYMGTSEFAVPALLALAERGEEVALAVTQPDKARGRGGRILPTPVKKAAAGAGIPTSEPERLRDNADFLAALAKIAPDLIVAASYGKILPKEILVLPRLGCVNIHASLLPKYRGAAPVRWAIADGEEETGVTLIYMGEGLDDGDMIARRSIPVGESDAGELTGRLAALGAELLIEQLPAIADGSARGVPQEEALATYARKIEKEDAHIDLRDDALTAIRRIRAMNPEPGAFVLQGDTRIKIVKAHAVGAGPCAGFSEAGSETRRGAAPGEILSVSAEGLAVQTGDGTLVIDVVGMPGKRAMSIADYLRGNRIDETRPLR
ncbi:MAG: methionyl-tRNA formyltransferase [Clostridiales Family XIII bacterium]|jgi:methionyl-tRNA formyltransferase|nr:methionyl-tRNA formyltransferase [Clostridiales Family XIII bacterium]